MNVAEILGQLTEVMRDVLDKPSLQVTAETTAKDVPEWDSLAHVQLVTAVEKHFKIRFTTKELNGFRNVGEMCNGIEKRISG